MNTHGNPPPQEQPPSGSGPGQPPGWQSPPGASGWGPPGDQRPAGDERTGPLPLRPMTLADILDGSFKLFRANLRSIVILTSLFVVPVNLVAAFLQRSTLGGASFLDTIFNPSVSEPDFLLPDAGDLVASAGTALFSLLTTPFVAGLVSKVVGASYLGRRLEWGEALRGTVGRFWSLLGAFVLIHLVEFAPIVVSVVLAAVAGAAGEAALLVPAVLLIPVAAVATLVAMAFYLMTTPAIVAENLGAVAAMRRSWRLVRPRFWPVLGIGFLAGVVAYIVGSILGTPFEAGALAVGFGIGWPLLALSGIIPQLVATPFVAIVATLIYYDGRIRHEGLDLEIVAADLGHDQEQRRGPGQGPDQGSGTGSGGDHHR